MSRVQPRFVGKSGRTLEEHEDIARSIKTDPLGSRSVTLDFEGGDLSGWSTRRLAREYSAVIQSEIVRSGKMACRFEIRNGDRVSQGLRAELRDWYNAPFEEETCYAFSTYLPAGFAPPRDVGVVLAQWHDQAELGEPAGKPPLAIRYLDGTLRFTGAFSEIASHNPDRRYVFREVSPVPRETWMDFSFRIRWSRKGASRIRARLDGQDLFEFEGPLGYRNQVKGPYFKFGVYASGDIVEPLVVYHDEYRREAVADLETTAPREPS